MKSEKNCLNKNITVSFYFSSILGKHVSRFLLHVKNASRKSQNA